MRVKHRRVSACTHVDQPALTSKSRVLPLRRVGAMHSRDAMATVRIKSTHPTGRQGVGVATIDSR